MGNTACYHMRIRAASAACSTGAELHQVPSSVASRNLCDQRCSLPPARVLSAAQSSIVHSCRAAARLRSHRESLALL